MLNKKNIALLENEYEKYQEMQNRLFQIMADHKSCFVQRMQRALPVLCALLDLAGAKVMHTLVIAPFYHHETREAAYGLPVDDHIFEIRKNFPQGEEIQPRTFYKYCVALGDNCAKHFYYYALEKSSENQVVSELIFVLQENCSKDDQLKRQKQIHQILKTIVAILSARFAMEKLGEEKDKLKTVINNAPAGIVSLNRCMSIETWNGFMEKITGLSAKDIILMDQPKHKKGELSKVRIIPHLKNIPLSDALLERTAGLISMQKIMTAAYQQDSRRIDVEGVRYNNRVLTVSYIPRIHEVKKTGLDIIVIDKTYEYIDLGKTELYNDKYYRLFSSNLTKRLEDKGPLLYHGVMLDLDHFKKVNDTYGHDCGDYVLREVGGIIKNTCQEMLGKYALPFRLGGEEFYVLIENCDHAKALLLTKEIKKKISAYNFIYNKQKFTCTISSGIAAGDEKDPDITKHRADMALYQAKGPRNSIAVYSKEIDPS